MRRDKLGAVVSCPRAAYKPSRGSRRACAVRVDANSPLEHGFEFISLQHLSSCGMQVVW